MSIQKLRTLRKGPRHPEDQHSKTGAEGTYNNRRSTSVFITYHSPRNSGKELGEAKGSCHESGVITKCIAGKTHVFHHKCNEREQHIDCGQRININLNVRYSAIVQKWIEDILLRASQI